jgi:hypothetical protein
MTEKPARSEILPNGAGYCWLPALRKFAVVDSEGHVHGYRHDSEAARELAQRLPAHPAEPSPEPTSISRSPHALPLPPETYLPAGPRPDERPLPEPAPRVVHSNAFNASRRMYSRSRGR